MTVTASPAKRGVQTRTSSKWTHPPTLEMITRAITVESDPKGTSVMAIKRHILANHQFRSAPLLNHMLRRAFAAGLASGKLTRPRGQTDAALLAGRYRLVPVKPNNPKAAVDDKHRIILKKDIQRVKVPAKKIFQMAKKATAEKAPRKSAPGRKTPKRTA